MRRLEILLLSLFLVIACQKLENILVVDPNLPQKTGAGNLPFVAGISPVAGGQLIDQSNQPGIQGKIEVLFSDFMDEATLTSANIEIWNSTTNSQITGGITTEYFPEISKLYIYLENGASATGFYIRLKSGGITNTYGAPLDFDRDNLADGSPYDDYLSTFWTEGNTDTLIATSQAYIATDLAPYRTPFQQPVITIAFGNIGAFGMDTLTLVTGNFALVDKDGNSYPLNRLIMTGTLIQLQPTGELPLGQNFKLNIKSANIRKVTKSSTPDYLKILDGNANGPQATEPDTNLFFRVDTVIPPTVDASDISGGAIFTFSRLIDEATINSKTIKVFDNIGYVPGEFRSYTDYANTHTLVEYYYKRATNGDPDAFVSKAIKDKTKDYYLDGDGNEIGGEPWDDYWEYDF